jgi:hypothetical protein
VLQALWEHRAEHLTRTGQADPVYNAEGRYLSIIARLRGNPQPAPPPAPAGDDRQTRELQDELYRIRDLPAQRRGYAFETFLARAFDAAGLAAREPFRNTGEQIDGSFVLGDEVLEAKWQSAPTPASDLHSFHGKLDQKAAWARGLFVSYNGFTADGLQAFGTGKRMVCMDGRDLYETLGASIPLQIVLERKIRRAAETGQIFVSVRELFSLPRL